MTLWWPQWVTCPLLLCVAQFPCAQQPLTGVNKHLSKRLLYFLWCLPFLQALIYEMGKLNLPQGVVPALPMSSLLCPDMSPDGFSTGVTAHLCTSAARYYFQNRPSMTRSSEKHLKVQDCKKKTPLFKRNPHRSESILHDSWAAWYLKYFCGALPSKSSAWDCKTTCQSTHSISAQLLE